MPTHSGIKLEILSSLELAVHTEFPHPESSQFTFRSPNPKHIAEWETPAISKSSKADALLGRNTTSAVYVPSVAGARFWLRYDVEDLAVQRSKFYYFKLLMNGRHIASFGVDVTKKPHGQIMHGLFDPSQAWNYEHEGEVWKNNGLERRPFFFVGMDKNRSVVNDGGLIEVLCFRAIGRRRKIPDPESWRDQHDYGIVTASNGLHEHPEQAKFYDWHLKDPKTNPLVVFKFHYRSWESLKMLELIPADHPCKMEQPERALLPEELKAVLEVKSKDFNFLHKPHQPCYDCKPMIPASTDESSLDETDSDEDFPGLYDYHEISSGVGNGPNFWAEGEISPLKIRRRRPTAPMFKVTGSNMGGTISPTGSPLPRTVKHGALDAFSERPLPDIPTRSGSRTSRHSRTSSTVSRAPSVTPSLFSYIDRDGSMSPEPQFGVASRIEFIRIGPVRVPSLKSDTDTTDVTEPLMTPTPKVITIEEFSPLPRDANSSPNLHRKPTLANILESSVSKIIKKKPSVVSAPLIRRQDISAPLSTDLVPSSSLPNVTIRKHRHSSSKKLPPLPKSKTMGNMSHRQEGSDDLTAEELAALDLSEADWMSKGVLAFSSTATDDYLEELPAPNTFSRNMVPERLSSLGHAMKRKSTSWYKRKGRATSKSENTPDNSSSDLSPHIEEGNWI